MIDVIVVGTIAANCWIVELPDDGAAATRPCAVIDPGGDPHAIIARLRRLNLRPVSVLLTHGHFDHVAGLPGLLADGIIHADVSSPPIVAIHRLDAEYLGPSAYGQHRRDFEPIGALSYVDEAWADMPAPDRLLEDGDEVGPFRVMHVPGHTPGSICLYDEAGGNLFSGDTLFADGIGRTDLYGGDAEAMASSLRRLLDLPPRTVVHPGHGPKTSIGREKRGLGN
jgi:glyoxylase-like metal-dependent hydrolase (beta-lactamase superfamily II)